MYMNFFHSKASTKDIRLKTFNTLSLFFFFSGERLTLVKVESINTVQTGSFISSTSVYLVLLLNCLTGRRASFSKREDKLHEEYP